MTRLALLLLLALAAAAPAEEASVSATVVATRPLRAQSVLTASDLSLEPGATPGAVTRIEDAVGLETRRGLYPGRPVMAGDLAPPALVERNAMVLLRYRDGALTIETDGRALGRGGMGERVRVMNVDSRNSVTGVVVAPNTVEVR